MNSHQQYHHPWFFGGGGPLLLEEGQRTPADVMPGRGGESNNNPGNIQYRNIVERLLPNYRNAETEDQRKILANTVLQAVRQSGGRFLQADKQHVDRYYIMSDEEALKKIKQRFYDATKHDGNDGTNRQTQIRTTAPATTTAKIKPTKKKTSVHPLPPDPVAKKLPVIDLSAPTNATLAPPCSKPPPCLPPLPPEQELLLAEQRRKNEKSWPSRTLNAPSTSLTDVAVAAAAALPMPPSNNGQLRFMDDRITLDRQLQHLRQQQEHEHVNNLTNEQLYTMMVHPLCFPLSDLARSLLMERARQAEQIMLLENANQLLGTQLLQGTTQAPFQADWQPTTTATSTTTTTLPFQPQQRSTTASLTSERMNATTTTAASIGQSTMRTETTTRSVLSQKRRRVREGSTSMSISSLSLLFSTAASLGRPSVNSADVQSANGRLEENTYFNMDEYKPPPPKEFEYSEYQSVATMSDLGDFDMENMSTGGASGILDGPKQTPGWQSSFKFDTLKADIDDKHRQMLRDREARAQGNDPFLGTLLPVEMDSQNYGTNEGDSGAPMNYHNHDDEDVGTDLSISDDDEDNDATDLTRDY